MKRNKTQKGITLVALIITIIVLLILAVVAIRAVQGDGIIAHAKNARDNYNQAQIEENGTLQNYTDYITEQLESSGGKTPVFDPSTLTIGTAINAEKYGWKVPGYTVTTSEFTTGVWRLFYQDSEYTYLITDEVVGNYTPSDYYESYSNGSQVSIVGQKLSPTISSFFVESNTYDNIRATTWFTDTDYWKDYAKGEAVFAIASPTAELFAASYNATNQGHTITFGKGNYGYSNNIETNWLSTSAKHGIYNKSTSSTWWLASPGLSAGDISEGNIGTGCLRVDGLHSNILDNSLSCTFQSGGVRPLVCIRTSVFNSSYANNMVDA